MLRNTLASLIAAAACVASALGQDETPFHGKPANLSCTIRYVITAKEKTDKVVLTTLVPRTIPGKQRILKVKYSRNPDQEFVENGNRYAIFTVTSLRAPVEIRIDFDADLFHYDRTIAEKFKPSEARPDLKKWLIHEGRLEKDALELREPLKSIAGGGDWKTVEQIMAYLEANIKYSGHAVKDRGALGTLQEKKGDCGDFTDLLVAMCRAKGVPARICDGYLTAGVAKHDTPNHTWAEVYLKDLGWVPLDPLHTIQKATRLPEMKNQYVYMTNIRNDPRLENNHFCVYRYYGRPIVFQDTFAAAKR